MAGILKRQTPKTEVARTVEPAIPLTFSKNVELEELFKRDAEDTIVIGEVVIHRDENGLFSLNDIYEASGRVPNKRPADFFRTDSGKKELEKPQDADNPSILTKKGTGSGSWVDKRLAYKYASYLDEDFHDVVFKTFESVQTEQLKQVKVVALALADSKAKTLKELEEAQKEADYNSQAALFFQENLENVKQKFLDSVSRSPRRKAEALSFSQSLATDELAIQNEALRTALPLLQLARDNLVKFSKDPTRVQQPKDALERLDRALEALDPGSTL